MTKNSKKINELIKDIMKTPYSGLGKPEALKFDLSGYWSRRIDMEHRLVYKVIDDEILIYAFAGIITIPKHLWRIRNRPPI